MKRSIYLIPVLLFSISVIAMADVLPRNSGRSQPQQPNNGSTPTSNTPPFLDASDSTPSTQPGESSKQRVIIELSEKDVPTAIRMPRKMLDAQPAAKVDAGGNSLLPTAMIGIAMSLAITFGGLHFFSKREISNAAKAVLIITGMLVVGAGAVYGDAAFAQRPAPRRATNRPQPGQAPQVSGPVSVSTNEEGDVVRIVISRKLVTDLATQPPF